MARDTQHHRLHALDGAAAVHAFGPLTRNRWTVLHDIAWPERRFAVVDHVAVGPSGVFVVVSTTDESLLRPDVDPRLHTDVARAEAAAAALRQVLPEWVSDRLQVVVSVVGSTPHELRVGDDLVVTTAVLADVLSSLPAVWADWQVLAAVDDVRWVAVRERDRRHARRPTVRPERPRRAAAAVVGAVAVAGATAALVGQPGLAAETVQLVGGLLGPASDGP